MGLQGLSQILIIFNLRPNCTLGVKMGKERMNGKPLFKVKDNSKTMRHNFIVNGFPKTLTKDINIPSKDKSL